MMLSGMIVLFMHESESYVQFGCLGIRVTLFDKVDESKYVVVGFRVLLQSMFSLKVLFEAFDFIAERCTV